MRQRDGADGKRYSLGVAAVISDINSGAAKWLEAEQRFHHRHMTEMMLHQSRHNASKISTGNMLGFVLFLLRNSSSNILEMLIFLISNDEYWGISQIALLVLYDFCGISL